MIVLTGYYYFNHSYFLGLHENKVTIFKGIPLTLGNFKLGKVEEKTLLNKEMVVLPYRQRLEEGIVVPNKEEAYRLIKDITSLP